MNDGGGGRSEVGDGRPSPGRGVGNFNESAVSQYRRIDGSGYRRKSQVGEGVGISGTTVLYSHCVRK